MQPTIVPGNERTKLLTPPDNSAVQPIKFDDDSFIAKKEYDKLYKKYSKKYSDKELDYVIRQKLYQKGFKYENQ